MYRKYWSKEEDQKLEELVGAQSEIGIGINWTKIAIHFTDRSAKQCHQHYHQQLAPRSKEKWSDEEDAELFMLVTEYGRAWSKIAKLMSKNRTRNQVKNRYNSQMNRKSALPEEQRIHIYASQYKSKAKGVQKKSTEMIECTEVVSSGDDNDLNST